MLTTKNVRARGRPRKFDPEEAVATACSLFHARGYDGVSVSDLTKALGINPPSFYAAFGSKAGLYARVLDLYATAGAIPLADILRPERSMAEALTAVFEEAAHRYSADPEAAGCLVIEGSRCVDREARKAADAFQVQARETIRAYIAARFPDEADQLTDFVGTVLAGLSAEARNGHALERLLATARLAGSAVEQAVRA